MKVKKKLYLYIIFIFINATVYAAEPVDSLYSNFQEAASLDEKYKTGEKLIWSYIYSDLDKALLFYDTLARIAQEVGEKEVWKVEHVKSEIFRLEGKEEKAIEILNLLLEEATLKKWNNEKARVYRALGFLYHGLEDWEQAILYLEKSAKTYSAYSKKAEVVILYELANVYLIIGDTLKARDLNLDMLEVAEKEFSLKTLEHILEWSKELDEKYSQKCLYSEEELNQIFSSANRTNNKHMVLHFALSKMKCLLQREKERELLNFGSDLQAEFDLYDDLKMRKAFYDMMEKASIGLMQWKQAYQFSVKHDSLKNKLFDKEKIASINRQELKYRELVNRKLEQEKISVLKEKEQSNRLNIILLCLGATLSLLFVLLWKQREAKQKLEKEKLENELWQLQFNPHFFFNALTSIQAFIYEKKTISAIKSINQLSSLFRNTLGRSQQEWTKLSDELAFIKEYIKIHQLISGNKVNFQLKIDQDLESTAVEVPPFLIQPILENAIKHGFKAGKDNANIDLIIQKGKDFSLKTIIRNNGEKYNKNSKVKATSLGLRITNKRLAKYKLEQNVVKIENKEINNENWVEVSFFIPWK